MSGIGMSDIIALLKEDWVPEQKKAQLRNLILDTIDMAEDMTKKMKESLGER